MRGYACFEGQCSAGYTCDERGMCVPATCQDSSQCMRGCYCTSGNCVETHACNSDGDCASLGMVCDVQRHTCQPQGTQPPPNNNPPPTSGCQTDANCPSGQTCFDGQCRDVVSGDPLKTCTYDGQCGGGICRPNYLGEGLCHAACQTDQDCGTGDTCQGGYCFINPDPPLHCIFNVNCGDGYTCINATCHVNCDSDAMCKNPADFCDQGICQPDWRVVSECVTDAECPHAGQECVNARCLYRCLQDADCATLPDGPMCVNGYCARPAQ
jgi:hypothetical protein